MGFQGSLSSRERTINGLVVVRFDGQTKFLSPVSAVSSHSSCPPSPLPCVFPGQVQIPQMQPAFAFFFYLYCHPVCPSEIFPYQHPIPNRVHATDTGKRSRI